MPRKKKEVIDERANIAKIVLVEAAKKLDLNRNVCPYLELEGGGRYRCVLCGPIDPEPKPCIFGGVSERKLVLRLRCVAARLLFGCEE